MLVLPNSAARAARELSQLAGTSTARLPPLPTGGAPMLLRVLGLVLWHASRHAAGTLTPEDEAAWGRVAAAARWLDAWALEAGWGGVQLLLTPVLRAGAGALSAAGGAPVAAAAVPEQPSASSATAAATGAGGGGKGEWEAEGVALVKPAGAAAGLAGKAGQPARRSELQHMREAWCLEVQTDAQLQREDLLHAPAVVPGVAGGRGPASRTPQQVEGLHARGAAVAAAAFELPPAAAMAVAAGGMVLLRQWLLTLVPHAA